MVTENFGLDQVTPEQAGGQSKRAGVCVGPEFSTVGPELLARAAVEASPGLPFDMLLLCGFAFDPHVSGDSLVVEKRVGTGSTDFWAISFSPSAFEHEPMDDKELDHKIALLRACWQFFDAVATRVSAEMRKGPRGGGRDRGGHSPAS